MADTRRAEINAVAASTGDDPGLDRLLLRPHTETACRRGGALALRPVDLDPDQCLILLREKGDTVRWQPVLPTLRNPCSGMPRSGSLQGRVSCCAISAAADHSSVIRPTGSSTDRTGPPKM